MSLNLCALRVATIAAITFGAMATTATIVTGETAMSADAFDRYTRGKTLFYSVNGERYGVEMYFDDRRVRWSFLDGRCKDGVWYEDTGDICFVYEDAPVPQCWVFYRSGSGLRAEFRNDASDSANDGREGDAAVYEVDGSDEEMLCLGPEVGA